VDWAGTALSVIHSDTGEKCTFLPLHCHILNYFM